MRTNRLIALTSSSWRAVLWASGLALVLSVFSGVAQSQPLPGTGSVPGIDLGSLDALLEVDPSLIAALLEVDPGLLNAILEVDPGLVAALLKKDPSLLPVVSEIDPGLVASISENDPGSVASAPEMDPSSLKAALMFLGVGVLLVTDRFRRRSA